MNFLKTSALLIPIFALTGCPEKETDAADDTDTNDTTDTVCTSSLDGFFPENGATEAFYRTSIEIMYGQAETNETASITVTTGGTAVEGSVSWSDDGMTAFFTPNAPLMPSTTYKVETSYSCDKTASAEWTTSDIGAPPDSMSLVGKVYALDIFSGRVVEPPGVGDLITQLIGQAGEPINILLSPYEYDAAAMTLGMRGALGVDEGGTLVQDVCTESINFPIAADFSENPYFEIEGTNVEIAVSDFALGIDSLKVTGAFSPNGDQIGGASAEAFVDARKITGVDLGDICSLVGIAGLSCIPCADGEPQCLALKIDSLVAPEVGTGGIALITTADVDGNAACATE
jgi:hypothetical protein